MKLFQKVFLFISLIVITPSFALAGDGAPEDKGIDQIINESFKPVSDAITSVVFYSVPIGEKDVPIVLIVLLVGALFFTLYFKFPNIRLLGTAVRVVKGNYEDMDEHTTDEKESDDNISVVDGDVLDTIKVEHAAGADGEVTPFQALTAALSATVGLGNIAGVAIAIAVGGPGATFWMIIAGLIGMASKFVECTLGVKYRDIDADGTVHGGPMYYLSKGLKEKGMAGFGKFLAIFFAIMAVGGSFGGGNMFQANQAAAQFIKMADIEYGAAGFIFGIVVAILVGIVIIGGIKKIGAVTEKVVPFMAVIYVGAALIIIGMNVSLVPEAFGMIFQGAFTPAAGLGGFLGVMIVGFQRAAFSNEAGVGSAAIAHSAVKTKYPASEGVVGLLEPFIDTVVICTMSALVIVIVNLKNGLFNYGNLDESSNVIINSTNEHLSGVDLTSLAFDTAIPHFSYVLTVAVVLFAFSTMLSWSYYGLQAWKFLFGKGKTTDLVYKALFLIFVVVGASIGLDSVIAFSDAMIFAMVFPNVIGLLILSPKVREEVKKFKEAIKLFKARKGS